MTELHKELYNVLRPIWVAEAERTGGYKYICRLKFLIKLQKQLGIDGNDIIKIEQLTPEQIEQVIELYEGIINE